MSGSKNTAWIAGTGVLALLAVVATYFLLVGPKRAEAADLRIQTASVRGSNDQLVQDTALLKSQFATLGEQKEKLAQIRQTLPSQADVPALIRQLSAYAAGSGVTLTAVTPSPASGYASTSGEATDTTGIIQIPLQVKVVGSFPQSELFIKNVQADMTRYFGVENVTVTEGGLDDAAGQVTTDIVGRIFVLATDAVVAPAGTTTASAETAPDSASTTGSAS